MAKVETTSEGYFSYYVSLAQGENVFKFENTTASKTYKITRTNGSSTNSGNANFKTVNLVGEINKTTLQFVQNLMKKMTTLFCLM